ncbi:Ig-like domain-containing protein [Methanofollis sp. UBA420]|jgi:hypothetical protein|uniref:Ig-like domain-containing protein n=1 Tax=Methanofollis sp. UBA420 TaxID=1915514 RepID=UPI00316AD395
MSIQRFGILLFGVLFLFCAGTAAAEPQMHLQADTAWLVAGGDGTSAVTVMVTDDGGVPRAGQSIVLSCDPAQGTVSPSTLTTGADGTATATFRAGTRSGTATITATSEYRDENDVLQTVSSSCDQMIDHAAPYKLAALEYESEITVGSTTPIVLAMEDRYGNRVDARKEAETVRFQVGSPGGLAGISDGSGYRDDVVLPVDGNGDVRADFRADQTAGENIIYVSFPGTVAATTLTIYGLGNAVPASIACSVAPYADPIPWVPADGRSTFTLTYTLKDTHGNPAGARSITVVTDDEDDKPTTLTSNSDGQVMFTYGPRDSIRVVTITATSADDLSVTCSQTVEFTSTAPVNMVLSANPQSMPSRDVKDDMTAEVRAKVLDEKGNPVEGEMVTFSLSSINTAGYTATASPELVETSATTDKNGYAVVHFRPGAFTRDHNDPAYSGTATGTCDVAAVWGDVSHTLSLTWKNYPYLSVSTSVDPETVEVNGTVNVTLALKGDGWALQPDPIDVVLVVDRSGSMARTDSSGNVRITSAKAAASTFIDQMNPGRDRVGLVSFSSSTTLDNYLTDDFASVKSRLQSLQPNGATQLRRAIYEAVRMQQQQGRPGAVKAIIIMTDGDWNYDGSPIGHGTGYPESSSWAYTFSGSNLEPDHYRYYDGLGGTLLTGQKYVRTWSGGYYADYQYCIDGESTNQNMSRFASSNDVKLYAITFAYDPSSTVTETMTTMSTSTGGFYEHAPGGDELAEIYKRIAGDLKTEAGVDTMMDLSFENVQVNDAPVPGDDVFAYQYIPGVSTNIASWIENESGHYQVIPLHTEDQTTDWEDDRSLHFDIGTVKLNQTWTTSYTLKVLSGGNINVFGSGSTISFNGGAETLTLPDTFITAIPDLNKTGVKNATLDLGIPYQIGSRPVTDFLKVGWHLNYTGNYTATQRLSYSTDRGKTWTPFLTMVPRSTGEYDEQASLDVRSLAVGWYKIRVHATAPDAPDCIEYYPGEIQVGDIQSNKIRLE